MHRIKFCVATLALLLAFPVLTAFGKSSTESKDARDRAAKKACLTGNTDKGVEILADLFIDTHDITYLYNQGRCFEQNRRYEDAIGRFREYLIKGTDLTDKEKADAERHIAVCASYLGKPEASVSGATAPGPTGVATAERTEIPPPPPPLPTTPAVVAPPPPTPIPLATVEKTSGNPPPPRGRGLRIAGLTTASVGAVALAAGVFLNLKGNSISRDLEGSDNYSRGRDSTRKAYQTLAWVGYGVGAGCLVGGTILYVLGLRAGRGDRSSVALAPVVDSGSVGAAISGGF
jgi:hypothetical protein